MKPYYEQDGITLPAPFPWFGGKRKVAAEHLMKILEKLPRVEWKGKRLYAIRCTGTSGKGPHDCNVPEGLLWQLLSLDAYLCVYHAGDRS